MPKLLRSKFVATALGIAAFSAMLPTAPAIGAEWKMSTTYVDTRSEIAFFKKFIAAAEEKSGGDLKIQLFTGGSLGVKDVDMLRVLPQGNAIQIATTQPTYLSRDQPSFAVALPTGVFDSVNDIEKVDNTLREIYGNVFDKWGIKLVGFLGHPASEGQIYCKTPVRTLNEMRTKKVRVWEKFQVDTLTELGVSAQIIPQNELYLALANGVVDCTLYAAPWANSLSLHEVAPYASFLFPLVLPPLNILASKKSYGQLGPKSQKALASAAGDIWTETMALWISGKQDAVEKKRYVDRGGKMLPPFSDADRAEYAAAARKVWEAAAKRVGPEAVEARRKILAALSAN